ncbi:MAG: tetratricopeptide repeat protein [Desulfobacterales bacterium]
MSEENKETDLPRCIVLPLLSGSGSEFNGIGLAIHFLLGNVIALHTRFREFWFGWRVGKVFKNANDLKAYNRSKAPSPNIKELGPEQKIRIWLKGRLQGSEGESKTELTLVDIEKEGEDRSGPFILDFDQNLIGFRTGFLTWLERYGFPIPESRRQKVLWPEAASPRGFDYLGRALEAFYIFSSWEGTALEPIWFERAVLEIPNSYMANNLKGWALYRNKDYASARKSFERALEINLDGVAAVGGMMWCGIVTGNEKEAYHWSAVKAELLMISIDGVQQKTARLLEKYR